MAASYGILIEQGKMSIKTLHVYECFSRLVLPSSCRIAGSYGDNQLLYLVSVEQLLRTRLRQMNKNRRKLGA